jgi:O-antigen/teichoic acid export membrane protein
MDLDRFRDLFNFGRWIFFLSVVNFLILQGDDMVVGKVLSTRALGLYQMAYKLSNLPATGLTHVISKVSFPAFSKLQDRPARLKKAYLETLQITALLAIPLTGGILVLASSFTKLFLGQRWEPMVTAMRLLAFWGLQRALSSTAAPLFRAVNELRIPARISTFQLLFLSIVVYPLTKLWGITGTSAAVVVSMAIPSVLALYRASQIVNCRISELIVRLKPSLVASAAMVGALLVVRRYGIVEVTRLTFFALVVLGVCVYFGIVWLLDEQLRGIVRSRVFVFQREGKAI